MITRTKIHEAFDMNQITEFLSYLGNSGLDLLVIPILIWTVISLAGLALFKISDNIHPAYQYHGRIAMLCALPVGILASYVGSLGTFSSPEGSEALSKFLVIQNPLSISVGSEAQATGSIDPALIIGIVIAAAILIMMGYISKIVLDIRSLNRFADHLHYHALSNLPNASSGNKNLIKESDTIKVAFSSQVEIPFTFGLIKKVIVLPEYLRNEPEKMNMALRHELIHIKHGDYLLNILLMTIKGTFWLHPLVHKFYKDFKNYRELLCDSQVLADKTIPQKGYAKLLFELAPKNVFPNYPTVSMSVNPSTLKKRIQTMKAQNSKNISAFGSSFTLMFLSLFLISGIMACTDIQENGITNSEIKETQSQLSQTPNSPEDGQPSFVINDEVLAESEKDVLTRIKTKYIENLEILKGQKAIDEFGQELGKNGVVKMTLYDKEAALNDLKSSSPPPPTGSAEEKPGDYFLVVEEAPQLIGGQESLYNCIQYPERAKRAGIEGRVFVRFIVNTEGQVEDPSIIRGIGGGADEEAIRCVKQLEFTAGKQRGKKVRTQYSLSVAFKMQS